MRANADFGFKTEVRAPRVEVRAEPVRANADFGFEVKAPKIEYQAPRVEVRAEPMRANADYGFEVSAPKVKFSQESNYNSRFSAQAPQAQVGFSTGGAIGFREEANYNAGISV